MRVSKSLLFLCVAVMAMNASAQLNVTNGQYNFRIFHSPSGLVEDTLRYWVRPPAGFSTSEKLPLLVHMHGTGRKSDDYLMDIFEQGTDQWDNELRCIVIQPLVPHDQGNWTNDAGNAGDHPMEPQPTHGIRMVMELVEFLQSQMNVDPTRVYVEGASMGGYASWDLILRKPELFAAACPMAGGGDSTKAYRIVSMPVRIHHGAGDLAAPVSGSRAMAKALLQRNANVYYYEVPPKKYPGNTDEHASGWYAAWRDDTFWPWMFAQSRLPDTTPPSVPSGLAGQALAGGDKTSLSWNASTDGEGGAVWYFVYRDGVTIASIGETEYLDTGLTESTTYQYQVAAFNPCDKVSAKTSAVSVQTTADTRPPAIDWVRAYSTTSLDVCFTEKVDLASAQAVSNYAIDMGVTVTSAAVQTDQQTVRLSVGGLSFGEGYILRVNNILDASAGQNRIAANSGEQFTCMESGYVVEEIWDGIADFRVADLTGSPKFGGPTDDLDTLRQFNNSPRRVGLYGSRVRGYFYPTRTGEYTFLVSSDNTSEFHLSTSEDPSQLELVAWVETVNMPRYEYDYVNDQKSAPIYLEKNTPCYFEFLFACGWADAFTLAYQYPLGKERRIVGPEHLIPYPSQHMPVDLRRGPGLASSRSSAPKVHIANAGGPVVSIQSAKHHRICIFNSRGAVVAFQESSGPAAYRLSQMGIPPGLYSVRVTVDGETIVRRMVTLK